MMDNQEHEQVVDSSTDQRLQDELTLEQKEDIYTRALFRARRRMALYIHATVFALVMLLLVVINLLTTPRELWVMWPFFGWGIGLSLHWFFATKRVQIYEHIKVKEIARQLEDRRPQ
jgi:hypothetical protein